MSSPRNRLTLYLYNGSIRATHAISRRWGQTLGFHHVIEYPKSGGTWLCRLICNYLDLPFPQHYLAPIACRAMIHAHWGYDPKLRRVFYLYRDGRDVMVSAYFHTVRRVLDDTNPVLQKSRTERMRAMLGDAFDPHDTVANLPKFIEASMSRPRRNQAPWPQHIRQWYDPSREHVAYLSYESLLADPIVTLGGALEKITGKPADHDLLGPIIDRYSFAQQTGRKPGEEDRGSFLRKGVAGDWVNHFNRRAAEVFDRYAGDELVLLGYEPDRSWLDRYEFVT